jgi:hypothetical protein
VIVTIIPLKGCQKYGYITLNQAGSNGDTLVKYGIIVFWIKESVINKESMMANLNK